ncbi:ATP-binding protein [Candidatus Albibeggiatoa sp. nov. NOAA]|uniref:sensor histidine kinase n=1 Tax=Candidatus Albibeggiatoa sp. nov. NOAA TaxID=3162724 RepID=UPI0033047239|nr:ATP-binding protein [Thiotrichaceae bacterium]
MEKSPTQETNTQLKNSRDDWKPLYLFNIYRLIIATFFWVSYLLGVAPNFFGQRDANSFFLLSLSYFALALLFNHAIRQRWFNFDIQVITQVLIDIAIITLLMHLSGGINSGLGMLLVVAIAGGSLLTQGKTAFFFAAMASLAVLAHVTFTNIYQWFTNTSYTHAGMLGISFFATAFLAHSLARRIRVSEALAEERGQHVQYLHELNRQIIEHIQSGIIVVDNTLFRRVQLFNDTAQRLLGLSEQPQYGDELGKWSPELVTELNQWQQIKEYHPQLFHPPQAEVDLLINFMRLSRAGKMGTSLIVLEDATLTAQRAQQLKLASLGRLTTSIAHEVRNPLDAISRAGQLLASSPSIHDNDDKRLTQIIANNTERVNTLIENILQFTRRGQVYTQYIDLDDWIHQFIEEITLERHLNSGDISLDVDDLPRRIGFDPIQLYQVVTNICENGLRYSQKNQPLLHFRLKLNSESQRPYLDIQDFGKGIDVENKNKIFEPFFTTETKGTGLGLYIAKEICEANRAVLHLIENELQGCCFRITFTELEKV